MSTKVRKIGVYKNGIWQDLAKVHDGSAYKNFRGVYSGGVWYEVGEFNWHLPGFSQDTLETFFGQYESIEFSVGGNSDGKYFYEVDWDTATVHQYGVVYTWDISSVGSSIASIDLSNDTSETVLDGFTFGDSGSKIYLLSYNNVYQYNLSVAWDLSTASYTGKNYTISEESSIEDISFRDNGNQFFACISGTVYVYNLSTTWDISTASWSSNSYSIDGGRGMFFKFDGSKVYFVEAYYINQYELSVNWDLSSIIKYHSRSFSEAELDTNLMDDVFFSSDGDIMYVRAGNVYQYILGYYLYLSKSSYTTDTSSDSFAVFVTANDSYSFSTNVSWLTSNKSSSSGNDNNTISIDENTTYSDRSGKVTVNSTNGGSKEVIVSQDGKSYYITASPSTFSFSESGGTDYSTIDTDGFDYNIDSVSDSWITATHNSSTQLEITVAANSSTSLRSGTIVLSHSQDSSTTVTIDINQGASVT